MSGFQKAERKAIKLKLAITGPSGAGKTYSALRLAGGLGKKIAVLDTENGSASLYSDKFQFDVNELTPPFTVDKFCEAIVGAEQAGYEVLVIDSITAEWTELLEEKTKLDSRPGSNHWVNWGPITKKHNRFINTINNSNIHIISTMRSKMDYMPSEDGGKKKIEKVGLAPQQRDGMEYEYTTVFDVAMNNDAAVSKDRTGLFAGKIFKITEDTGREFSIWLKGAKAVEPVPAQGKNVGSGPEENERPISTTEANEIYQMIGEDRVADFHKYLLKTYNVGAATGLNYRQFGEVMKLVSK